MNNSFIDRKNRIKNLENGKGIRYLLDEGFAILGNPIMMFDTSYTLIMFTDVVTDDWVWNEIAELGTFSQETVDFFNQEHFIEAFAHSETVAFMKSTHLKYERANGKLFDKDNVQLGNISIVACKKPFEDGDMELIELFCEILSVELQNSELYQNIDRVYQESILNRIIDGQTIDDEAVNEVLPKLYSELKSNLYVAVVDIAQYDATNTHMAYFRDVFKKTQNEYEYFIHLNNIVILISTDNEIISVTNELKELNEFFVRHDIYAGISSRFQDITALNTHHREAISALNYGLDSERKQNIFFYDDFRVEHFLNSILDGAAEICSPVVTAIQKYDSENNSTLFDVLYTYLLYGMNLSLAAGQLGKPESELSDELRTLEDLFRIDWTNGNMLFNIFLSIKVIKSLSQ